MIKKLENIHVFFWLLKDLSWCLVYEKLGVIMIIPTVIIAVIVAIKSYNKPSEFIHNVSILLWILANSIWMLTEFYEMEHDFFSTSLNGKYIATYFFAVGIIILLFHYIKLIICKTVNNEV